MIPRPAPDFCDFWAAPRTYEITAETSNPPASCTVYTLTIFGSANPSAGLKCDFLPGCSAVKGTTDSSSPAPPGQLRIASLQGGSQVSTLYQLKNVAKAYDDPYADINKFSCSGEDVGDLTKISLTTSGTESTNTAKWGVRSVRIDASDWANELGYGTYYVDVNANVVAGPGFTTVGIKSIRQVTQAMSSTSTTGTPLVKCGADAC